MWSYLRRLLGGTTTPPPDPMANSALTGIALTKDVLDRQIRYYDREARKYSLAYHSTKVATIVLAALIPFVAGRPEIVLPLAGSRVDTPLVTALLGVLIVIVEGLQQLFGLHENWIRYRSTCESLRTERFLYGAHANPYASGGASADQRLAEQVGALIRQEYARWATVQQQPGATSSQPSTPALDAPGHAGGSGG
jgi:hypothetical protein